MTGVIFKHYKGNRYELLNYGLMESNLDQVVMYRRVEGGAIWVRPMDDFFGEVTLPDGSKVRRFTQEVSP